MVVGARERYLPPSSLPPPVGEGAGPALYQVQHLGKWLIRGNSGTKRVHRAVDLEPSMQMEEG